MTARKDKSKSGCLETLGLMFGAWVVLTIIEAVAGRPAAMWFGAGFVVSAFIAFWEAGRAELAKDEPA